MPPPTLAPNASPRKQDRAEFGQKLAKRKSQELNSKVARWNSTGGGIVSGLVDKTSPAARPDAATLLEKTSDNLPVIVTVEPKDCNVVVDGGPSELENGNVHEPSEHVDRISPPASPPQIRTASGRFSRQVDLNRKAWVRRKSRTQADNLPAPDAAAVDVKHAGTPKKRVISDGHWRRDWVKMSPEDTKMLLPKPLNIWPSKANVALDSLSPSKSLPEKLEPRPLRAKHTRSSRSKSRSRSRERTPMPDYESSGTRLYVKRRDQSRPSDSRPTTRELRSSTSGHTETSTPRHDTKITREASPLGSSPVRMRHRSPDLTNVVDRYLKALSPADFFDPNRNIPQSPAPPEAYRKTHINKRDKSDGHTPQDCATDPSLSAPPKVFGNRIEGWLATTSDPFAKDDTYARRGRDATESASVHNPPLQRPDSDVYSDGSLCSPTLKRRGARRTATSPIKNRLSRDATPVISPSRVRKVSPSGQQSESWSLSRALPDLPGRASTRRAAAHRDDSGHSDYDDSRQGLVLLDSTVSASHLSEGDESRAAGDLHRRLTKHSDLMSVLSLQRNGTKGTRSRPSARTRRVAAEATASSIMNEVSADELRYQRELRTLVDGVIPVLLQHVLSQADTVSRANLLGQKRRDGQAVTKPIVDMGVALERLRSLHKRIPLHNHEDLLSWATGATAVYTDYLAVWRMGFQNIVVNLAPADDTAATKGSPDRANDLVDSHGECVDLAFLLKRPLVRIKHLARTFEALSQSQSSSTANEMSARYANLVQEAKRRLNEEKARLEDEAAAAIDHTRAREVRTLAPITGVHIDSTRCVRARDFFDLDLRHSNGQQLICKIELIMRDDVPEVGKAGDLLFCEVSTTGRWLLFPPVHSTMISARKGRKEKQLVVMLRGYRNDGSEWREVMALEADDDEAVLEWLTMLPNQPIPRNLASKSSFDLAKNPIMSGALPEPSSSSLGRMPSLKEIEVPIGERFDEASTVWDASEVNSDIGDLINISSGRRGATRRQSQPASMIVEEPYPEVPPTHVQARSTDSIRPISAHITREGIRPLSGGRGTRHSWKAHPTDPKPGIGVWLPQPSDHDFVEEDEVISTSMAGPNLRSRTSSVPSKDLPAVPKLRQNPRTREAPDYDDQSALYPDLQPPTSAPAKLQRRRTSPPENSRSPSDVTLTRIKRLSSGLKSGILPSLTPTFLKRHRRSSSPLKNEYEPSTDSSSDSEVSAADKDESFTSDSTVEPLQEEQISTIGELKTFPTYGGYKPMRQVTPPESLYAPSDPSLAPSQSASQAPYRTVPAQETRLRETSASIFAWADSGSWDSLHPEECCIIVTPGLVEAFDNAQAHAIPAENEEQAAQSPSLRGVKPLVALEMTPLVPLRRGTALDISIRSPPTANSLYRTGNNIMFRSRNAEECEALYHMLNRARIDNPTYVALQRARGPTAQSHWGELMDQRANARASGSWWTLGSRKSSTYRSKALSRPQSIAVTDSSVGTLNTAFSALRRFSGSNRIFNIAKSTITSRQGSRSTYSDSLDSGFASPAVIDPSMGTPLGLTNMKIRLYVRETASKWRDMGAARLTILIPPQPDPTLPANPNITGREKRVVITGKTQGEMLLDKTLGESCFERIARTGIAVSVWEENLDGLVATTGGVLTAKTRVYMIQMKSDREAAYTFGLVGKLRY